MSLIKNFISTVYTALKILFILILVIFILRLFVCKRVKIDNSREDPKIPGKIPVTTYTPPIIKIPFIKDEQPIKTNKLPIEKKQVKETIHIKLPDGKKIDLIIDKEDRVYFPIDAPSDITAKVIKWNPPIFEFRLKPGIGVYVNTENYFFSLALDYIRLQKFYFGTDVGFSNSKKLLVGVAIRYALLESKPRFALTCGYDLMRNGIYLGGTLGW